MNKLCDIPTFANKIPTRVVGRRHFRMASAFHVLSIGTVDRGSMVHDALLNGRDFHLTIATDYRVLWAQPKLESMQIAIVHNTLSSFEIEAACRLIRRRWPLARILAVLDRDSHLDGALYDDRVTPNLLPDVLLAAVLRLTGGWNEWRFSIANL